MSEEPHGIDPYEFVLTDLRAKRDQIDQAISAIESVRNGSAQPLGVGAMVREVSTSDLGPGSLLGMSIVDAAKKLLATKRTPLRNPEITALFKAGGLILNSKDWANTIGAVLTRRSIDVGDIVKVNRGTWGLKEWYPGRSFKAKLENGEKGEQASEAEEATPSTNAPAQP